MLLMARLVIVPMPVVFGVSKDCAGSQRDESLAWMAEEHRLPVGRPDFKSGEMHACVSGRFDSCLFRQKISSSPVFKFRARSGG